MEIRKYAYKVEEIGIGLHNLTGLGNAVYDALYHGTFTADGYEGAVFIFTQEVQRLSDLTEKVINEMYEELKHEKR